MDYISCAGGLRARIQTVYKELDNVRSVYMAN